MYVSPVVTTGPRRSVYQDLALALARAEAATVKSAQDAAREAIERIDIASFLERVGQASEGSLFHVDGEPQLVRWESGAGSL